MANSSTTEAKGEDCCGRPTLASKSHAGALPTHTHIRSITAATYSYSSSAEYTPTTPLDPTHLARLSSPSKGKSVVDHVNSTLNDVYDSKRLLKTMFSRRHPKRVRPGSVLSVTSYADATRTTASGFSGVLLGIRRRGVDTAFTLRNVVNKTGVEVAFKVCSPMIKNIHVVKRADGEKGGLKDLGRARVNYLRERPGLMTQIAAALKQRK
jgi:large subunit ribosomal protein L19